MEVSSWPFPRKQLATQVGPTVNHHLAHRTRPVELVNPQSSGVRIYWLGIFFNALRYIRW